MIAEDLGVITPPVRKMIKKCGYPGMKVLQFAFDSYDSEYLPHNYDKNCIVYTQPMTIRRPAAGTKKTTARCRNTFVSTCG